MKKLSIIAGFALVMALVAGPAFAMSYSLDICTPGTCDGVLGDTDLTLSGGNPIEVQIFLVDYTETAPIDAVDFYLTWDDTKLSLTSVTPGTTANGGDFDDYYEMYDTWTDQVALGVSSTTGGVTPTGGQTLLATALLNGLCTTAACDADVEATNGSDGRVYDTGAVEYFPTAAPGVIHQTVPECDCEVSPASASLSDGNETEDFDPVTLNPAYCGTTPVYVFSDDCTHGSVDSVTGLFTANSPVMDDSCTVTLNDTANGVVCTADVTMTMTSPCDIEIYTGGAPVPPLNTYNKPGRRGLAATCEDEIIFCPCHDCENPICPDWSIVGGPAGTTIVPDGDCAILTIGPCDTPEYPMTIEVTVTDTCATPTTITDTVEVIVGEVTLTVESQTVQTTVDQFEVEVSMINQDHAIKGMQIELADDGDLVCTSCEADSDRALNFTCTATEAADGDCNVMLVSIDDEIAQGEGVVLTVSFDGPGDALDEDCINVWVRSNAMVADRFGCALCVCRVSGQICFKTCGDIYPAECLPDDPICGDGVVDIFDVLEAIDIALGIQIPTDCQLAHGDVPGGTPPYCGCEGDDDCQTNGVIDLFDVLVIIDMALDKANCCDYCATGSIL